MLALQVQLNDSSDADLDLALDCRVTQLRHEFLTDPSPNAFAMVARLVQSISCFAIF